MRTRILIAFLRGLFPNRPALLGYRADAAAGVPATRVLRFESLEIALAEAAAAGGNIILAPPENYRAALIAGDAAARRAWQSLGRTARFLSGRMARLSSPVSSRIAVAASSLERHGEILNMLFRGNAPAVVSPEESLASFRLDLVGLWLGGHEPGNVNLYRIARERGLSDTFNPWDVPVYEWLDGRAIRRELSSFPRTPLKTYYLQKPANPNTTW